MAVNTLLQGMPSTAQASSGQRGLDSLDGCPEWADRLQSPGHTPLTPVSAWSAPGQIWLFPVAPSRSL